MKFINIEPVIGEDGAKVLDVSLFGEIDPGFFGDGVASKEIAAMLAAHADATKIMVRINSIGGDLFGGLAIYNLLRNHGAEVTSIVEGLAASAASIVAMAGRTVMGRGAMLMIHNPMTFTIGDAEDHRQQADVLDKARDSLLAVYQAKTGKKAGELRKMLDAETWLTAEEAKREGFADEIADKPTKAKAMADAVLVNSVLFRREGVPAPILAMATAPAPAVEDRSPRDPPEPITLAKLEAMAPELLKAIRAEERAAGIEEGTKAGHAAGVAAERARLQAIDDLGLRGCDDLIVAAKYGAAPIDARDLAVLAIKAGKIAGLEILEARAKESKAAAGVRQSAPEKSTEASELETAKSIAEYANRRRGGK